MKDLFTIGKSKYSEGGYLVFDKYEVDDSLCIVIMNDEEGAQSTATVWLDGAPQLENHVWLKGWSDNQGLPEALAAANVVTLIDVEFPAGHCKAQLARLSDEVIAHLATKITKILNVNKRGMPRQPFFRYATPSGGINYKVVLVEGNANDYSAYIGAGSEKWVAAHGDKLSFTEARFHFPFINEKKYRR
jgi:hypothetical protein